MASTAKSQDRWDGLERLLYDYSLTELLEASQNNPSRLIMAELHLRLSLAEQWRPVTDEFSRVEGDMDIAPFIYLG